MTVYLSEAEAHALGFDALTHPEALAPAPTPLYAAAVLTSDTPLPMPPGAPKRAPMPGAATTTAYALLRAALALSAARYGAPYVSRVLGGYAVRLSDRLAYGVDISEPLVTLVSQHVYAAGKWRRLEVLRLPKLTAHELLSLFVTGKE